METIDTNPPAGFVEAFYETVVRHPDRVFLRFNGQAVTFGELSETADRFRHRLFGGRPGRGKIVAAVADNSIASVALAVALAQAGAVWVSINPQLGARGFAHIFTDAAPAIIVADGRYLDAVNEARKETATTAAVIATDSLLREAAGVGAASGIPTPPQPADLFALMYTSGTTGKPKAVKVTHRMMRMAAEAVAIVTEARSGDVMFMWEPLFHIGGAQMLILPMVRDVQLAMVPKFSATRFWSDVAAARATHIHYLGGVLQILLRQPPAEDEKANGARIAWGAGCTRDIWGTVESRFGVQVRECYGMTEASSITSFNADATPNSVGKALPWFTVSIRAEDGSELPPGERGEIAVRETVQGTGAIFSGYLGNAEATHERLRDGILYTGDIGSLDRDGNLYFHGRKTDSIRYRGQNISAWEIEHVVLTHPLVEECAAIGIKADIGEEEIKLFVRPVRPDAISADEMFRWMEDNLPRFQMPRHLRFVDDFPRTGSSRIMKHLLSRDASDSEDRARLGAL
jgi:crotonobetaine/carnitine-CoA ligase